MSDTKSANRPRLGRGLSSLISSSIVAPDVPAVPAQAQGTYVPSDGGAVATAVAGGPAVVSAAASPQAVAASPIEIPCDNITPNPYQPRREFRPDELAELTESIRRQGVLQPLIVALPTDNTAAGMDATTRGYVLIAGERRLRAAKAAGLASVPCVIRQATACQMLEWALVENIQRADLNPMEKAWAYREYIDRFAITQVQAAEALGQPRTTVANYLRLLELATEVQTMVSCGTLSFGHAKVLAGVVHDSPTQLVLARRVVAEGWSVRQLEDEAAKCGGGAAPAAAEDPKPARVKPPFLRDLEEQLTTVVGTKVRIMPGKAKHSGRIVVEFYSLDDFDRIAEKLGVKSAE